MQLSTRNLKHPIKRHISIWDARSALSYKVPVRNQHWLDCSENQVDCKEKLESGRAVAKNMKNQPASQLQVQVNNSGIKGFPTSTKEDENRKQQYKADQFTGRLKSG